MADRVMAHVELINKITPIEGADNIEVAHVLGWQVVVRKAENHHIGNKIVYIEIDSRCPANAEWAQFLAPRNYKVKSIKLRGQISQGLIMPMSILPVGEYEVGQDVAKILGIEKIQDDYVVPTVSPEQRMRSKRPDLFKKKWFKHFMRYAWFREVAFKWMFRKAPHEDKFPTQFEFVKKTDEIRVQSWPEVLENKNPMIITEKLEGSSATYILERLSKKKFKFYVCSRNVCQTTEKHECYYDENIYWIIAKKYDIQNKLSEMLQVRPNWKYIAIQGEIIGPKICGNIYSLEDYDFYVFNFISPDNGRYGSVEAREIVRSYGFKFVPILDTCYTLPNTVDEMLAYAEAQSVISPTDREGVVIRSRDGSVSFKAVSNRYLLKKAKKEAKNEV